MDYLDYMDFCKALIRKMSLLFTHSHIKWQQSTKQGFFVFPEHVVIDDFLYSVVCICAKL